MSTRITVEQLEQMKTHELAELLANVVLVLRRMPNVPCRDLQPLLTHELPNEIAVPSLQVTSASYSQAALKKMLLPQLKEVANTLNIPFTTKTKKDELISKILARQATQGHSEQYSIQHI
jgi:hypothetical protein